MPHSTLARRLATLEAPRGGRGFLIVYEDDAGHLWHHNTWHPERRPVTAAEREAARRQRRTIIRVVYIDRWRDPLPGEKTYRATEEWNPDAA